MIRKMEIKRIRQVEAQVEREMFGHSGGTVARGMASEGYAGGYLQALRDVVLFLDCRVEPDTRGYWVKPAAQPKDAGEVELHGNVECTGCNSLISMQSLGDADGFCPNCGAEIELDDCATQPEVAQS